MARTGLVQRGICLLVAITLAWLLIGTLLPNQPIEVETLARLSAELRANLPIDQRRQDGQLTQRLFPWLTSWEHLDRSRLRSTMGIVIPVGDRYVSLAAHAIRVLRFWNCTLPIEVVHMGPTDLSAAAVEYFDSLANTSTLDLSHVLDNSRLGLERWAIKPFAVLYSSFEQVLLMDADVVWLQEPMQLWQDRGFQQTGALFFTDRLMKKSSHQRPGRGDHASWLQSFLPRPLSPALLASPMFQGRSDHHQESGVILINKTRGVDGLLAACMLNDPRVRGTVREMTFGEKETFWLGYEIARQAYSFHPGTVGSIGAAMHSAERGDYLICGHLAHLDLAGRVLWFNDGIVKNKHIMDMALAPLSHVISGGQWFDICMRNHQVSPLPPDQASAMTAIIGLWQNLTL